MKRFFGIEGRYQFEYNDLRALITVINVVLVMKFGLSIAWFGLAIAIIGLLKDLATDRKINGLVMHFSSVALNLFFIGQIQDAYLCILFLYLCTAARAQARVAEITIITRPAVFVKTFFDKFLLYTSPKTVIHFFSKTYCNLSAVLS